MNGITMHILGSGNPHEPDNFIFRARLKYALPIRRNEGSIVIYGRQQQDMKKSEAELGFEYVHCHQTGLASVAIVTTPKSTSETMALVTGAIHTSYQRYGSLGRNDPPLHYIVTNWPYVERTRYLLKKQWKRLYPDIAWKKIDRLVGFIPAGGTFVPRWKKYGLRTIPWWLWNVFARECGAWLKALRDPYDRRLNQDRASAKIFRG